ncbi:MAG: threonylcarbamoyl-AMP synthase [Candidatus Sungbacteria bacterium]|uniref:L-threonylcarbamoyladenylate synthase n=1 Tax=Candidatus Sungiibacteriota bacterium TaxID=2750080 RepID=A0A932DSN1_9BACT|nr:threonylcarbamoyl-AMP synthase [Candidatus Sungbacteria bacterium]
MKILDIRNNFSPELASKEAALALLKGRTVVYPTDTLYGLGANIFDTEAIRKIFAVKKRSDKKPLPVMVSSIGMAKAVAVIDSQRERILKNFWPGPFTFILKKKPTISFLVTAGRNSIALRMPSHTFCESLIRDFEGPITVTSANISGEESSPDPREIISRFLEEEIQPDVFIDDGVLPESDPSTIIDLTADNPRIVRINPTNKKNLLSILETIQIK